MLVEGRSLGLRGQFLNDTLFGRFLSEFSIYREEILGPVLAITRSTGDAAARLRNDYAFGRSAAIVARDVGCRAPVHPRDRHGCINVPIPCDGAPLVRPPGF